VNILQRIKKWADREMYKAWKSRMIAEAKKFNPLVCLPMLVFLELEADKIFEKEGLQAVGCAAQQKVIEIDQGFTKISQELLDARARLEKSLADYVPDLRFEDLEIGEEFIHSSIDHEGEEEAVKVSSKFFRTKSGILVKIGRWHTVKRPTLNSGS
jgi:hypothetical protein